VSCIVRSRLWQKGCPMCVAARPRTREALQGRLEMSSSCKTEKVVSTLCCNCHRHLATPDNFCRWCGFQQTELLPASARNFEGKTSETTVLGRNEQVVSRSISKLPMERLTQSVALTTGSLRLNRWGALVIAVLIAIPMWLLIILLSPFDAYLSARNAWVQMDIR
jgi:hypothetical protein